MKIAKKVYDKETNTNSRVLKRVQNLKQKIRSKKSNLHLIYLLCKINNKVSYVFKSFLTTS